MIEKWDAYDKYFNKIADGSLIRGEVIPDGVMQKCSGCCAVFSSNGDGSYKYAIGELNGDLRQFTKEMNAALNGRGGGKPFFVQGSVKASEDEIRQFFRQ